jgi:hypothetical protein
MPDVNPYETHRFVLEKLIEQFQVKNVLEFGMGVFSTPIFLKGCDKVLSIEMQEEEWFNKVVNMYKDENKFQALLKLGPMEACNYAKVLSETFDLVFVDGHGDSRVQQAESVMGKTNIIVLHDTEAKVYHWERMVIPEGWTWLDVTELNPWTSVLTNKEEVVKLIQDNFQTKTITSMKDKSFTNLYTHEDLETKTPPKPETKMIIDNFLDEYIHGDKFIPLAEYLIAEHQQEMPREILDQNACIMCHTQFLSRLFKFLEPSKNKYIVISHNSDDNITYNLYSLKPDCVVKWYAQNAIIDMPALVPLPIGIERPHCGWSWDMNLVKEEFNKDVMYENFVYMNHSDSTNKRERVPVTESMKDKVWITRETEKVPFTSYLKRLHNHKFVLSPPGNGADCIRTWEALYVQVIPVVKDQAMNVFFAKNLPILVVKDLAELTEEFLWEKYYEIKAKEWNYELLTMSYWNKVITADKKNLLGIGA